MRREGGLFSRPVSQECNNSGTVRTRSKPFQKKAWKREEGKQEGEKIGE